MKKEQVTIIFRIITITIVIVKEFFKKENNKNNKCRNKIVLQQRINCNQVFNIINMLII